MKLPFDLPAGHLPVIVRRPKVKSIKLADDTVIHEARNVRLLNLRSDRGLFDIGFMLNIRQFAKLSAAEQFTILALQRRLTFCGKLVFPDLRDTGQLFAVEGFDDKYVWAIIPETVITTSRFTVLDLHDQCMAIDEPDALRETIAQAFQGCTDGDVEEMLKRFCNFKPPHVTDISRALNALVKLGIVRKYIKVDRHRRRAVFNMRMTAATKSGILSGMIKAEDMLSNVEGSSVTFSADLASVGPPAKRVNSTSTGKRRKLTRGDYQSKYHSEKAKLKRAEKLVENYENSGYLTPEQFTELRNVQDDPTVPSKLREDLTSVFETARTDPHTEIPTTVTKKEIQNG
jgi:hypothetical protein